MVRAAPARAATPACTGKNRAGKPCGAPVLAGRDVCRFHDETPEGRARFIEGSRRGGQAHAVPPQPPGAPLCEDPALVDVDLGTPDGLRSVLAASLRGLARLPFDTKVAAALTQAAQAQRAVIDLAEIDARLRALEEARDAA